jgi:O-antigen/teichoic acid export membrane protein
LATQDLALRAIAVPAALLPALTVRLAASDGAGMARALSNRLFLAIVPGAVIGCAAAALLSDLVIALLYPRLPAAEAVACLRVLLIGIAASAVAQFPNARLAAAGRARDAALMHLGQFLIYLVVVPPVVVRHGAVGAAMLWSGRIVLDAAMLIVWSGMAQQERAAMVREGCVLVAGVLVVLAAGLLG